jgi:hypothetical protein
MPVEEGLMHLVTLVVLFFFGVLGVLQVAIPNQAVSDEVPLPEHPRPDFYREAWINLNGTWEFRFDTEDSGETAGWQDGQVEFSDQIRVPFSWGSPLSGVKDEADIGWYMRTVKVPREWDGQRVFLVIGASDWKTSVWLDGKPIGTHQGGYTPFELELTPDLRPGEEQRLVLRIDDSPHPFKLEGKQGYGPARGIWQTVYLEARGTNPIAAVQFTPDIDAEKVLVKVLLTDSLDEAAELQFRFDPGVGPQDNTAVKLQNGVKSAQFEIRLPEPRLWSLRDPFLYNVELSLRGGDLKEDRVSSYFGMRKISVVPLPGTDHPYIALNGEPIYLQMALDQAYHPEGYYTFPNDDFVRDEIIRALKIGLNGIRIHVKVGIPRKLYWADRLGMLVMADVPNSWGEPSAEMRAEVEKAFRGMVGRDFNHPSIFSWVLFNETWGLRTIQEITEASGEVREQREYREETQQWVASMYRLAKELDPTRLVEDNSPNSRDHVVTDINSWHAYLPGYAWEKFLGEVSADTFPGSSWNFAEGYSQNKQPNLNSECGNVWGYQGSTGDVDWSWDYHWMLNQFRRQPKICGWLYTEHHDVINEWNGYYRYDRSEKFTGLSDLVDGMTLADLHSPIYLSTGGDLGREVTVGSEVEIPLWVSALTTSLPSGDAVLRWRLFGWDGLGRKVDFAEGSRVLRLEPWMNGAVAPLVVEMPDRPALAILALLLKDQLGNVLHRNFAVFRVADEADNDREDIFSDGRRMTIIRIAPDAFQKAEWSEKQWSVLDGLKVNGAGSGYFEYVLNWPSDLDSRKVQQATVTVELSAKQLLGKDHDPEARLEGDYMRGGGVSNRSLNPNAYPMTDTDRFPTIVRIRVNGVAIDSQYLADDPADHRGVLSWMAQPRDRHLREAGSYGYLVKAEVPRRVLNQAAAEREIRIRFEVDPSFPGGLAIYGKRFGRYPLDPTVTLISGP